MKTVTRQSTYEEVIKLPRAQHRKPRRPVFALQVLIRLLSAYDLLPTRFTWETHGMERIGRNEPCLILMNHSSFIDLEIASRIFFPRPYGIVTTADSFVGPLMQRLLPLVGCIPTQKFVSDVSLIRDMQYMLKEQKTSVLMYPEASYSFDGTATPLPRRMGILLKKLGVPVVTVITQGAFARQPLYNSLKKRKVSVRADVTCLFTAEEVAAMSVAELDAKLDAIFGFDNFRWQQENKVVIDEPDRADGLNRILYKCPHCNAEGKTEGKGTGLVCRNCGAEYELTELGNLKGERPIFTHIPDWYRWEREQVRKELEEGAYRLDVDVDIGMMVNYDAIYMVGTGHLTHTAEGFHLMGCDGKLDYSQGPLACYGLYADYYWYEIADVICIGNKDVSYYCFPKGSADVVAKTRLAAEELYKMKKVRRQKASV